MAKSTKLQIKTSKEGKEVSKSVTYVNPAKSNGELSTFARQLNSLSSNTLDSVIRIDRENITHATEE